MILFDAEGQGNLLSDRRITPDQGANTPRSPEGPLRLRESTTASGLSLATSTRIADQQTPNVPRLDPSGLLTHDPQQSR
jgi:hypothetical protein